MSWWIVELLLSWPLAGVGAWWGVLRPINRLTLGDLLALPLCVLLGWFAALMAIIELGLLSRVSDVVLWERRR